MGHVGLVPVLCASSLETSGQPWPWDWLCEGGDGEGGLMLSCAELW